MTTSEKLIELVALLNATNTEWDEVESLLVEFPGWHALIRGLRYPVRPMDNRIVWGPIPSEFTQVSEVDRVRLLELFTPFSILAKADLTTAARAAALRDAGTDPLAFCREHRNDAIPEISERAAELLAAVAADRTLLRGHSAESARDHLVRPTDGGASNSMSLPVEERKSANAPPRIGWLKRLLGK